MFKKYLLGVIRTNPLKIFDIHNPTWIQELGKLRLQFSNPNEPKFKYNLNQINLLCLRNITIELTCHYFIRFEKFYILYKFCNSGSLLGNRLENLLIFLIKYFLGVKHSKKEMSYRF